MSWSVQFLGKPEKVVEALQKQSETMTDVASKAEYDSALPHLIAIVNENFGTDYPIKFAASGHGMAAAKNPTRQLSVSLETVYGLLV